MSDARSVVPVAAPPADYRDSVEVRRVGRADVELRVSAALKAETARGLLRLARVYAGTARAKAAVGLVDEYALALAVAGVSADLVADVFDVALATSAKGYPVPAEIVECAKVVKKRNAEHGVALEPPLPVWPLHPADPCPDCGAGPRVRGEWRPKRCAGQGVHPECPTECRHPAHFDDEGNPTRGTHDAWALSFVVSYPPRCEHWVRVPAADVYVHPRHLSDAQLAGARVVAGPPPASEPPQSGTWRPSGELARDRDALRRLMLGETPRPAVAAVAGPTPRRTLAPVAEALRLPPGVSPDPDDA